MKKLPLVIILLAYIGHISSSFSAVNTKRKCEIIRAAFDIGSGSTKMKVAKVDRCKQKIIEMLVEQSNGVGYKQDLQTNDGKFSTNIMTEGLKSLSDLKNLALRNGAEQFLAVATSAFRKASNGQDFASTIQKQLGIETTVINQDTEAELGFLAAAGKSNHSKDKIIVWDIGGGSMQISHMGSNGKINSYKGNIAAVTFKNMIIKDILKKDIKKYNSPNPLGTIAGLKVKKLAKELARQEIPADIIAFAQKSGVKVIGIGGVHYYSIRNQTKRKKTFRQKDILKTYRKRVLYDDHKIGGNYASTDVSNLALVLGYMQAMNIKNVIPLKINMADGLLISTL